MEHGRQRGLVVVKGNVSDKAQPTLIDANQWHAKLRQLPAYAQHGPIATDHQSEVALLANLRNIQNGMPRNAGILSGVFFQRYVATLLNQEARDVLQCRA
jgi:hypothetical protein